MKQNNLLASVALFSELYNSETYKGIPEILTDFIKGAIIYENKFSFNSTELKELMIKVYGFDIPESVLRNVLKTKFKDIITSENNSFHLNIEKANKFESFEKNVEEINNLQDELLEGLYQFIKIQKKITLIDQGIKNEIFNAFTALLMGTGSSENYSDLVSAYIVINENNESFKSQLHLIKEGLILYQGITYTDNISHLGNWNTELTIYLSTEHLFNSLGYNGILFKEIFDDFFNLVLEINNSNKNKRIPKLISLMYLEETKKEIEYFFQSAESITKGYKRLDPSKFAMVNILKNCKSPSDIKAKLVKFYSELDQKGINYQSFSFDINDAEFNVVDMSLIEELRKKSEENNRSFDEYYCTETLKIFTKINTFRRGRNKLPFENIRHLYITENNFAKYLAHNEKVKFEEYDIAFAKDIDFIISKFWFKLKKGFNKTNILPKSFDVINKAKIILSSHINYSLSNNYQKLHDQFKRGELTEEQALALNSAFKDKPQAPEELNSENVDVILNFLHDDQIQENFLREKTKKDLLLEETLKQKKKLEQEIKKFEDKEKNRLELIERENLENKIKEFISFQWKSHKHEQFNNFLYYLMVTFFTIIPVFIGLGMKIIDPINKWLVINNKFQIFILASLIILFLVEVQGRSYIFNKEKVKAGWNWLKILISFKYKKYKEEKLLFFKTNYKL